MRGAEAVREPIWDRPAGDGLRAALERRLNEPTFDYHTLASRTFFDKAMASPTQEITISAQMLRVLLPQIEAEAVGDALRAALAAPAGEGLRADDLDKALNDVGVTLDRRKVEAVAAALAANTSPEDGSDIEQAGRGGPDFTPKEWPEARSDG